MCAPLAATLPVLNNVFTNDEEFSANSEYQKYVSFFNTYMMTDTEFYIYNDNKFFDMNFMAGMQIYINSKQVVSVARSM